MKTIHTIFKVLFLLMFLYSCRDDDHSPITEMSGASLLSPTKDQVCEQGVNTVGDSSRLIFEWEKDEHATSYDLVVNDIESGENFIIYKEIYTTSKELELVHNRAYQWYVISRNASKESEAVSEKWNFYFVGEPKNNYTPFPTRLLEPSFGAAITSVDGVVDFVWSSTDPDGDTMRYDLYLDEIDGMQEPIETRKNLEQPNISVQLENGKTYFWRVKASDGSSSSYSQVYSFKIN